MSSVDNREQFLNDNALAPNLGARSHNPTRLEALGILGKSDRLLRTDSSMFPNFKRACAAEMAQWVRLVASAGSDSSTKLPMSLN